MVNSIIITTRNFSCTNDFDIEFTDDVTAYFCTADYFSGIQKHPPNHARAFNILIDW